VAGAGACGCCEQAAATNGIMLAASVRPMVHLIVISPTHLNA